MARRRLMSEALREELARDLGVYGIAARYGWGAVPARECGRLVRQAVLRAEALLAQQRTPAGHGAPWGGQGSGQPLSRQPWKGQPAAPGAIWPGSGALAARGAFTPAPGMTPGIAAPARIGTNGAPAGYGQPFRPTQEPALPDQPPWTVPAPAAVASTGTGFAGIGAARGFNGVGPAGPFAGVDPASAGLLQPARRGW